jgi:coenzyme F420-0:L-glutamate ligase/coenzyme F420-1:gamma-L-glutamate ligase
MDTGSGHVLKPRGARIQVVGLAGVPMVKAGDDVGSLIVTAAGKNDAEIDDGDILVVAQKVISKAEDRIVEIGSVQPSEQALQIASATGKDPRIVQLVLGESKRFLKASNQILIVKDRRDLVNINAGIDKSNVEGVHRYALLPVDPDKSAVRLRDRIRELTGKKVGVIVTDTYSRAFRRGQVNFAIGLAGIQPFIDYRGHRDLFGYILQVKFTAVADELASAAELVMGQGAEGIPVVIIKGFDSVVSDESSPCKDLLIDAEEDLFKNVW